MKLVLLATFCVLSREFILGDGYRCRTYEPTREDVGTPLLLTPYINTNRISTARSLAAVTGTPFDNLDMPSYSGFFTVNQQFNSNLFFWFFPAQHDYENVPLLLWLQGGPGESSLYGLFEEIGPFTLAKDYITLEPNPYSWHKNHSLIFIDNPVGTGFSFTDFDEGYATNQTQIGLELYSALDQFLTLFPELRSLPLYVTGESYAGKYVPALAYTIHHKNPTATHKINLHGIVVGNGWTDPVNMMDMSSVVYYLGLADDKMRQEMKKDEEDAVRAIKAGNYDEAEDIRKTIVHRFMSHTEIEYPYNFLKDKASSKHGDYSCFVQGNDVRKGLHVGDAEYSHHGKTLSYLLQDVMKSVRPWLEEVLDNYRVLYYSGQLDIVVAYPLSVNMYRKLQFNAAEEYHNAKRYPWFVGEELAGFVKSAGNFTEVLVRNAEHSVPMDQPKWALDLITKFTRDTLKYPYIGKHYQQNH